MNKRLRRVPGLSRDLLQCCSGGDLYSTADVIGKTRIDLLACLDVPIELVDELLQVVSLSACPKRWTVGRTFGKR
jgi:hypothetical protein